MHRLGLAVFAIAAIVASFSVHPGTSAIAIAQTTTPVPCPSSSLAPGASPSPASTATPSASELATAAAQASAIVSANPSAAAVTPDPSVTPIASADNGCPSPSTASATTSSTSTTGSSSTSGLTTSTSGSTSALTSGNCVATVDQSLGNSASVQADVPLIMNAAAAQGVTAPAQVAEVLATASGETDNFNTMYESGSPSYYAKYNGVLGNTSAADGYTYRGRGFVQMTGKANYAKFGGLIGTDLVDNPDLAASPSIAAEVLVVGMKDGSFTGVSLSTFLSNGRTDFADADQIVNESDEASTVAPTAQTIYSALLSCSQN